MEYTLIGVRSGKSAIFGYFLYQENDMKAFQKYIADTSEGLRAAIVHQMNRRLVGLREYEPAPWMTPLEIVNREFQIANLHGKN